MIVIVGEAPSRTSDPAAPFGEGLGRRRLEDLLCLKLDDPDVVATNLLSEWPGSSGPKGAAFPIERARREAESIELNLRPDHSVVMVGLRVARAFGIVTSFFAPFMLGRSPAVAGPVPAIVVPHPSGVSRWWNYEERVADGRRIMRRWVAERRGR